MEEEEDEEERERRKGQTLTFRLLPKRENPINLLENCLEKNYRVTKNG